MTSHAYGVILDQALANLVRSLRCLSFFLLLTAAESWPKMMLDWNCGTSLWMAPVNLSEEATLS